MPRQAGILNSALDAVGHTPLIRLDRIAKDAGLKCNLLGKVEYMSSGGSVKDRIAKRMVEAAEAEGKLIPGKSVVIEPTSGNTGIGLAMACAIKGYSVIITMPEKMSMEKEAALRALGAEVRLRDSIPYGIILDQYRNVNNPLAHEFTTGPEIIEDVTDTPSTPSRLSSGKVDVFVAGAGTGGTVTGISRALRKQHNPKCIVIGVDPKGSVLAYPDTLNDKADDGIPYVVEGIGYDFIPDVLSRGPETVDHWIKTSDAEAYAAVRLLMKKEGLLVGGSSGSSLGGALAWFKTEAGKKVADTEGLNVVVLLPDGVRNYIGKEWFLDLSLKGEPSPLLHQIKDILCPGIASPKL